MRGQPCGALHGSVNTRFSADKNVWLMHPKSVESPEHDEARSPVRLAVGPPRFPGSPFPASQGTGPPGQDGCASHAP